MRTNRTYSYLSLIDGGGWQGWHCEGGPLKTLFGLLFWDVLFDKDESDPRLLFVTPYQDCPLDLGYASFVRRRQSLIFSRLSSIASLSTQQILTTLSTVYRAHFNVTCRGVNWAYSLSVLQLIAVCMGGR
eukprot:gene45040-56063_t